MDQPPEWLETTRDGRLRIEFHPGQLRAWDSAKRIVCVLAGTQGGKTSFGPLWLWREIKTRGPGDYLVVAPTFPLLGRKALPEFRRMFEERRWSQRPEAEPVQLGEYVGSPAARFTFSPEGCRLMFGHIPDVSTNVYFGHASDPDSLEAATAKAAWLDEAGQKKFRLGSWEAILRRLSVHQGRILVTTTPYDLGWLKQQLWDPWMDASRNHPLIDVIRFDSTENPAFPPAEYERARASLPRWKFDLYYRAIFTRPAGLIYDNFDEDLHKVPRFALPAAWPRFLGLDFGGVNTAGLFYAKEMDAGGNHWTGRLYLYREYKAGGRTAAGHVKALLDGEQCRPFAVGGSASEDQWRQEFCSAGLAVHEPAITGADSVEVGIDRVYGAHAKGEILVFDDLAGYLDEKLSYSRELDESGQPTEKIEDKDSFHLMDAERYIVGYLKGRGEVWGPIGEDPGSRTLISQAPPGVFLS
jgi:hypothetical protein